MRSRSVRLVAPVLVMLAGIPTPRAAQTVQESPSLRSLKRARSLAGQSLAALGGPLDGRGLDSLAIVGVGIEDFAVAYQGRAPVAPNPKDFQEWFAIDISGNQVGYESRTAREDGSLRWRREVYRGRDELLSVDLTARSASLRRSPEYGARSWRRLRQAPHYVLRGPGER